MLFSFGCDGTPTGSSASPGVKVISGAGAADSVEATIPSLVMEVRGPDSRVAAGAQVVLQAPADNSYTGYALLLGSAGGGLSSRLQPTADSKGRVTVRVRLGTIAARVPLAVSVPALGLSDTVWVTINAGAAARVSLAPHDTAALVGNAFPLRPVVQDRWGNPRPDTVALTPGGGPVGLTGVSVAGTAVGRGYVVGRYGGAVDTAWVSVVPDGQIAAYEPPALTSGDRQTVVRPGRVVTFRTDGSNFRVLVSGNADFIPFGFGEGMQPSWAPSGTALAYVDDGKLWETDLAGQARMVYSGAIPVVNEYAPQYSPDGGWIYFTQGTFGSQHTFARVRRDGTGVVQVSPSLDWGIEVMPSPDPSGSFIAFQTNRATNSPVDFTLRTLRVSTRVVTALDVPGTSPHWSPDGAWIAYRGNDSKLRKIHPDGSAGQAVGDVGLLPAFSWSPDGSWIVLAGNQPRPVRAVGVGISLVNAATGEVLPLSFGRNLAQPSIKR
ncbi:MAG TPA: hypothetical protein VFH27_09275 [Longimicrobiaceae bacterium]|nr:hypothetical protein [Longimicrobiaceae bacterium]